jgi:hypothetical protein
MYAEHQPLIAQHATTAGGFIDVVTFVIATQNQHFHRVGAVLADLHSVGLDSAKYLTRTQKNGIAYVTQSADRYLDLFHNPDVSDHSKMRALIDIPHIGIVKAGFIMQLICGTVGCLDRHNLQTLGLDPKAFARVPVSATALEARIKTYIATCAGLGLCCDLYDGWCRLIAAKYPDKFKNADDVSYWHVAWCGIYDQGECDSAIYTV